MYQKFRPCITVNYNLRNERVGSQTKFVCDTSKQITKLCTVDKHIVDNKERELHDKIKKAKQNVKIGGIYHHYRNPKLKYEVLNVGLDEVSTEPAVIYKALYNNLIWVRRISVWCDQIEYKGKKISRFTLVD